MSEASRFRVPIHGRPTGFVHVENGATVGAQVGVNLTLNGILVRPEDILNIYANPGGSSTQFPVTYWRLIQEIPPNVTALENTATTGLYTITGAGTSATREIEAAVGELTITDGDGIAGNPALGLADVPDAGGGTLQKTAFDAKGRRTGTSAATTDDLPEGATNLYFTDERAVAAVGAAGISGAEILIQDGSFAPPVMLTNEAENDFLYGDS